MTATSAFRLLGIDHVVLRVRDVDRMLAFYTEVLGCRVARINRAVDLYHLQAGSAMIDLIPVSGKLGRQRGAPPGREGQNVDHIALRIEPFDEATIRAHLGRHGIAAAAAATRFGAEGDGPSIYLSDPEGNGVELKGPAAG